MKAKIIILTIAAGILAALFYQHKEIQRLRLDSERYRNNTEALLEDVEEYKINDSLSAARVGILELKLSEFEKYRADDAELIRKIKAKNQDLTAASKAQAETIIELKGRVKDTIVNVTDTLYCIDIGDDWFHLKGCADKSRDFVGILEDRQSLVIYETTRYKRFLGFLWKTKKIKSREINVVSKNPHTKKVTFEHVEIKK